MLTEKNFESREEASAVAADDIAARLTASLERDGQATIVLSGGTTPARCFEILSRQALAWNRVQLVMSDERWVPSSHDDSNEKLLREKLRQNAARDASILSVYDSDLTVDERCDSLQKQLPTHNFACSLLGMGADGHFASLFPDAGNLPAGLDRESTQFYMPVRTAASPHPRVSMTLAALLRSDAIMLLFYGEQKRAIFERAKSGDMSLPVSSLLEQDDVPVTCYWAP